jgi:hypothetical protein
VEDGGPRLFHKYQGVNRYSLANLAQRGFWFADPTALNDPFDCGYRVVPSKSETLLVPGGMGAGMIIDKWQAWREGLPFGVRAEYHRRIDDALRMVGLLCLSAVHDQMLMWSHYADGHRGFCLGFHWKGDAPCVPVAVEYGGPFPEFSLEEFVARHGELVHRILYTKGREWRCEEEHRVFVDVCSESQRFRPWEGLAELAVVYLGARMAPGDEATVTRLVGTGVPIRHMEQVAGRYQVQVQSAPGSDACLQRCS